MPAVIHIAILHIGHVSTPKDRHEVNESHLELQGDEHKVNEGDERPHLPAHQKCRQSLTSCFINSLL